MKTLNSQSKNYYLFFNLPLQILCVLSLFFISNWIVVIFSFLIGYVLVYWLGIQAGYHKLFSHKSWVPKNNFIKYLIAILGLFGLMGGPIVWAQMHRRHHAYSDTDDDPHSPKHGFLHSYYTWLYKLPNINLILIKDLLRDKKLITIDKYSKHVVLLFLLVLFAIDFNLFLGFLLACCITFHSEMLVNSLLHGKENNLWTAKNNRILSWVSGGSTLHKNHHDNTRLNNLKLKPNEFDGSYFFIKVFSK